MVTQFHISLDHQPSLLVQPNRFRELAHVLYYRSTHKKQEDTNVTKPGSAKRGGGRTWGPKSLFKILTNLVKSLTPTLMMSVDLKMNLGEKVPEAKCLLWCLNKNTTTFFIIILQYIYRTTYSFYLFVFFNVFFADDICAFIFLFFQNCILYHV